VIGAHRYSEEDLREGRIIAKISVPRTERERYPKYGLVPGQVTYWWVRTDASGRRGTSVFVTTTGQTDLAPVTRTLIRTLDNDPAYKDDPSYKERDPQQLKMEFQYPGVAADTFSRKLPGLRRAIVRWLWTLKDETASGRCGSGGCR